MKQEKIQAPLYEALEALAACGNARFHMPGHKGNPIFAEFADIFEIDYTETYGTGNLYEGTEPIRSAEKKAAAVYGAADCHFLTGGSTQGIHAMLCAAVGNGGSILLDRSCHKSTVSGCVLFDLTPQFLYPPITEPFGFSGVFCAQAVEKALQAHPETAAMLVVSPNYYGVIQDIPMLAALCHQYGKKLLVDAAHGAHFPAIGLPSPIEQGADAAVLSAHKTLPALGQGAYLVFADTIDGAALRRAEAMVGTSSPSYPIMTTLDLSRAWMMGEGGEFYRRVARFNTHLRRYCNRHTALRVVGTEHFANLDPCRLVLDAASIGMTGYALQDMLYETYGIACEMADSRCTVLILTGADTPNDLLRLLHALRRIGKTAKRLPDAPPLPPMPTAQRVCSVREAWFAACKTVSAAKAVGKICARAVTPYPPGIPLLWPGEKITAAHIEFLTERCYTDIAEIQVLA